MLRLTAVQNSKENQLTNDCYQDQIWQVILLVSWWEFVKKKFMVDVEAMYSRGSAVIFKIPVVGESWYR